MKTVKFFSLALAFLSFAATSTMACDQVVDSSKVILFINTNASYGEADSAKQAACKRGESFVEIPARGVNIVNRMNNLNNEKENISKTYQDLDCAGAFNDSTITQCQGIYARIREIDIEDRDLRSQVPRVDKALLNREVARLSSSNKAITSAVFSGHDGGGFIEGLTGKIQKNDFFSAMNSSYGDKPQLKNQLSSVLLWGCYTTTPEEIMEWKANLPNLKIIGGFLGMGPSNEALAASTVMADLLEQESTITGSSSSEAIRRTLSGLDNIEYTYAGVYVRNCANCNENYFYRNQRGEFFEPFENMNQCDSTEVAEQMQLLRGYDSGDNPLYGSDTNLRDLYGFARENDHCFNVAHPMEGDRIGLLLFFSTVKDNFGRVFNSLALEAEAELVGSNIENVLGDLEDDQRLNLLERFTGNADKERVKNEIRDFRRELSSLRSLHSENSFRLPTRENLREMNRKFILSNIAKMQKLVTHPLISSSATIANSVKNLITVHDKMERYLHRLSPRCMDFLEWHEYEGDLPTPKC